MLDIFRKRLDAAGRSGDITPVCQDIRSVSLAPANAVVVNFTLQSIPTVEGYPAPVRAMIIATARPR